MLRITDLIVERGGHEVLSGISLDIAAGERVSLHGPSGCGKTTLLLAIAGLVPVTGGSISIANRDITRLPPHERGIGLVFQDDQLFPHFDVADNVSYALRVRGIRRDKRRSTADVWLQKVGLAGFASRRIDSLSGGEAKRVALARTLAANPSVVLLDEPLSGLDDELHDRLLTDLRDLFISMGTTVLHVTHDRVEGSRLCDRSADFESLTSPR